MPLELQLQLLAILGLLTAGLHWLIARSYIMRWFWGRLSPGGFLDQLVRCPACSGFWLGLLVWSTGVRPLVGIFADGPILSHRVIEALATSLVALVLTPIFEGAMLWGLMASAFNEEADSTPKEHQSEQDGGDSHPTASS